MFYYRYRSGSELAIKELIYDELYFASREECNDPYEGKTFAIFSANKELWKNLINASLEAHKMEFGQSLKRIEQSLKEKVVEYFLSKSPMPMENILKISRDEFINIGARSFEQRILPLMLDAIQDYVMWYSPEERYFASFSKTNDNFLLWSHYANNHKGFCLVYRPIDGKIKQNPSWKRTQTATLPLPRLTFGAHDAFEIQDVEYVATPKSSDGFMCFPTSVAGDNHSPEEIEAARAERVKNYFQKHSVWDYEQEARVVLSSGVQWFAGKKLTLPAHQRLFHIDSTQLVGIILGSQMPANQRQRIKEIIAEKVERWSIPTTDHRIISNFVLFEETLSETNREVIIEPKEIYTGTSVITSKQPNFAHLYDEWQNGWAIETKGNSSKRIQVK